MSNEQSVQNTNKLIDATDCLEAMSVFREWKNFLFVIIFFFLLASQATFWLVDCGNVKIKDKFSVIVEKAVQPAAVQPVQQENKEPSKLFGGGSKKIEEAAKQVVGEPNAEAQPAPAQKPAPVFNFSVSVTTSQLARFIRLVNFVLIAASMFYCLTMLFCLKISLLGRFGGINHIARAFFLAMLATVLLLPWQRFFPGFMIGVIYSPAELLNCIDTPPRDVWATVSVYARFAAFWLLIFLFFFAAQLRSMRWTRNMLRRLEVL